jgi:hypothetical protein
MNISKFVCVYIYIYIYIYINIKYPGEGPTTDWVVYICCTFYADIRCRHCNSRDSSASRMIANRANRAHSPTWSMVHGRSPIYHASNLQFCCTFYADIRCRHCNSRESSASRMIANRASRAHFGAYTVKHRHHDGRGSSEESPRTTRVRRSQSCRCNVLTGP